MGINILLKNLEYDISNLNNFYNGYIILFKGVYIFSEDKGIERLIDILSENPSLTEIKDKIKDIYKGYEKENIGHKIISISKRRTLTIYNFETQKKESLKNYPEAKIIPCSIYIESDKTLKICAMMLIVVTCLLGLLCTDILNKNLYIFDIIEKNNNYLVLCFLVPFLSVIGLGLGYNKIVEYYIRNKMLRNLEKK